MKNIVGLRIKSKRIELGMTQKELADKLGYTNKSTIGKIESGINDITQSRLVAFADVLQTTPSYLMGWDDESAETNVVKEELSAYGLRPVTMHKIPHLGKIACGTPIYADEEHDSYVDSDVNATFCLTAKGDSMVNAKIYDGDIVFIKEMPTVDNGDIAAVVIDDEATLKRVYIDKGTLMLVAENPKYAPLMFTAEDAKNVKILGKAIMVEHWL